MKGAMSTHWGKAPETTDSHFWKQKHRDTAPETTDNHSCTNRQKDQVRWATEDTASHVAASR